MRYRAPILGCIPAQVACSALHLGGHIHELLVRTFGDGLSERFRLGFAGGWYIAVDSELPFSLDV